MIPGLPPSSGLTRQFTQENPYPEQHPVPVQVPVIMLRWIAPVLFFERK